MKKLIFDNATQGWPASFEQFEHLQNGMMETFATIIKSLVTNESITSDKLIILNGVTFEANGENTRESVTEGFIYYQDEIYFCPAREYDKVVDAGVERVWEINQQDTPLFHADGRSYPARTVGHIHFSYDAPSSAKQSFSASSAYFSDLISKHLKIAKTDTQIITDDNSGLQGEGDLSSDISLSIKPGGVTNSKIGDREISDSKLDNSIKIGSLSNLNNGINDGNIVEAINHVNSKLNDVSGGSSGLSVRVDNLETELSDTTGRLNTTKDDVESNKSRLTSAEGDITGHGSLLTTVENNITGHDSRITSAEGSISNHAGRIVTTETNITNQGNRLNTAEVDISNHESRLSTAETNISTTTNRQINTGANSGLQGGGNLSANRSLSIKPSGVVASMIGNNEVTNDKLAPDIKIGSLTNIPSGLNNSNVITAINGVNDNLNNLQGYLKLNAMDYVSLDLNSLNQPMPQGAFRKPNNSIIDSNHVKLFTISVNNVKDRYFLTSYDETEVLDGSNTTKHLCIADIVNNTGQVLPNGHKIYVVFSNESITFTNTVNGGFINYCFLLKWPAGNYQPGDFEFPEILANFSSSNTTIHRNIRDLGSLLINIPRDNNTLYGEIWEFGGFTNLDSAKYLDVFEITYYEFGGFNFNRKPDWIITDKFRVFDQDLLHERTTQPAE